MKFKSEKAGEIFRFVIVGGFCFLVEFSTLMLLRSVLHMDTLVANVPAFLLSVLANYILCVLWVFPKSNDAGAAVRIAFFITSLVGLGLNELFMLIFRLIFGEELILFTIFGIDVKMVMINKCMATLLVMVWNFISKRKVLYSKKK
ncbi:MAG: GtrA family protein [Clostridia bacterium]|nr:GtrA family protein [Clostridia bacterium]